MGIGEIVGVAVGLAALCGVAWRLIRGIYRLVRIGETALDRLGNVEAQLKKNGGNSARDMLDKIHTVAVESAANVARLEAKVALVEEGQGDAAVLASEAAALAGTADDRIRALRDDLVEIERKAEQRHDENSVRLDRLERSAYEEWQRREFYLATLKELHGIDLGQPEGDV